MEQSFQ